MKTLRIVTMLIFIILLSFNYISCNNEKTSIEIEIPLSTKEKLYKDFENNQHIKSKTIIETDSILTFAGLNNNYIWFVEYDAKSYSKIYEWKDNVKTDTIIKFYNPNTATFTKPHGLYNLVPIFRLKTSKGEIHSFFFNIPELDGRITLFGYQTIFTHSSSNKRTMIENASTSDIRLQYPVKLNSIYSPIKWYDDSFVLGSSLYRINGDSLYSNKDFYYDRIAVGSYIPISYEEVITSSSSGITRKNLKLNKRNWFLPIGSIYDLFNFKDITEFDIKNLTLLNIDSNVGTFELTIQKFGMASEKYQFKVDLVNGKVI